MKLLHISFTITILGILLIIILTNILQPKIIPINNITLKQLDKQIKTQGTITNIITHNEFQVITIKNQTKINILLNLPSTNLTKNQNIIVTGKLQQYKNQLQINANQIKLKSRHIKPNSNPNPSQNQKNNPNNNKPFQPTLFLLFRLSSFWLSNIRLNS